MALEIERKFLLRDDSWRAQVQLSEPMRQGYLSRDEHSAIRVRITGEQAHINVKHSLDGIHRLEYEYDIPLDDADEMLDKVAQRPLIEKTRHEIKIGAHTWEIDEFFGDNAGLIVAEIELGDADEAFERPPWLGEEVSQDTRYFNSNLAVHPYKRW